MFIVFRGSGASGPYLKGGITGASGLDTGAPFTVLDQASAPAKAFTVLASNGASLAPRPRWRGYKNTFGLAVHELGHDLIDQQSLLSTNHQQSLGPYGVMDGVTPQTGGGADNRGGLVSTALRRELNWLGNGETKVEIASMSPGDSTRITLKDVGKYHEDGYVIVQPKDPDEFFILEFRDSTATFYTDGSKLDPGCVTYTDCCETYFGATGLLVSHISTRKQEEELPTCDVVYRTEGPEGWWNFEMGAGTFPWNCSPLGEDCNCGFNEPCPNELIPPAIDIEVATGLFDVGTYSPDANDGSDQMSTIENENSPSGWLETDVFRPGNVSVFTPYTTPNTNLYWDPGGDAETTPGSAYYEIEDCSKRQTQDRYSGISILNVDWVPGSGQTEIAVTIRYDGDTPPSGPFDIAPNTVWDGLVNLTTDVRVPTGETLTIREGTEIRLAAHQDLYGSDSKIEIFVDGTIEFEGTAANSIVFHSSRDGEVIGFPGNVESTPAAPGDWVGLAVGVSGQLIFDPLAADGVVKIQHAEEGVDFAAVATFEDIAKIDFSDNLVDAVFQQEVLVASTTQESIASDLVIEIQDDVVVQSNATLNIAQGVTIQANDVNTGDSDTIEITVEGMISALGDMSNRIQLTCLDTTPGSWDGVRFVDTADMNVSRFEYVDVSYPEYGVAVDSLACTLLKPAFFSTEKADVFVADPTRLAEGHIWDLVAPTKVCAQDRAAQTEDKVSILVNGRLATRGSGVSTDKVQFIVEPISVAATQNGNGWAGVTVQGTGYLGDGIGTVDLEHAEFAYAEYPLSLFAADTTGGGPRVVDSEFHHYAEEAILDWASDATISRNEIYRGQGLLEAASRGRVGIHAVESAGSITENTVFWQIERGIWLDYGSGWCSAPTPTEPTALAVVSDNHLIGYAPVQSSAYGIDVSWACRERNVEIEGNNVQGWLGDGSVGIKIRQSSDVKIDCNCIHRNQIGVMHRRDQVDWDNVENGYNVLADNHLQSEFDNVRTFRHGPIGEPTENTIDGVNTSGLCAGGGSVTSCPAAGGNVISRTSSNGRNWWLNSTEVRSDFAELNLWRDEEVDLDLTDTSLPFTIASTIEDESGTVVWQNFASPPWTTCVDVLADCPCEIDPGESAAALGSPCGASSMLETRNETTVDPEALGRGQSEEATTSVLTGVPSEFHFYPPRPNPSTGGVTLEFDVPASGPGRVSLEVFNAAGQRVRTVADSVVQPGHYSLRWDRSSGAGRVSSGVYFARIKFGATVETKRIVLQ